MTNRTSSSITAPDPPRVNHDTQKNTKIDNTSENPNTTTRTVAITVNDGDVDSSTVITLRFELEA